MFSKTIYENKNIQNNVENKNIISMIKKVEKARFRFLIIPAEFNKSSNLPSLNENVKYSQDFFSILN